MLNGAESLLAANRIRVVLFEYGHGWLAGQSDTSAANLETTVKWLDGLGYDVYLVGDVLLPLHGDCWFADLETWAWSNVVAVSRSAAPALAETLAERAAREVASVGGTECSLALSLNGAAVELRAAQSGCVPAVISIDAPWCFDYGKLAGSNPRRRDAPNGGRFWC